MEASKRPACSRCARPSDADRLPLRCLGRASFLDEGDGERGGAYVRDLVPAQPQDLVAPRCRQLSRHPERSKATANRPGARPGCPARCTAQAPAVSGSVRLWSASREPAIPSATDQLENQVRPVADCADLEDPRQSRVQAGEQGRLAANTARSRSSARAGAHLQPVLCALPAHAVDHALGAAAELLEYLQVAYRARTQRSTEGGHTTAIARPVARLTETSVDTVDSGLSTVRYGTWLPGKAGAHWLTRRIPRRPSRSTRTAASCNSKRRRRSTWKRSRRSARIARRRRRARSRRCCPA